MSSNLYLIITLTLLTIIISVIILPLTISCRSIPKEVLDECPCKLTKPKKIEHNDQETPASGLGSRIREALDRTSIYLKCKSEVEAGCLANKDFIGCYFKCERSCKFFAGIDADVDSDEESGE